MIEVPTVRIENPVGLADQALPTWDGLTASTLEARARSPSALPLPGQGPSYAVRGLPHLQPVRCGADFVRQGPLRADPGPGGAERAPGHVARGAGGPRTSPRSHPASFPASLTPVVTPPPRTSPPAGSAGSWPVRRPAEGRPCRSGAGTGRRRCSSCGRLPCPAAPQDQRADSGDRGEVCTGPHEQEHPGGIAAPGGVEPPADRDRQLAWALRVTDCPESRASRKVRTGPRPPPPGRAAGRWGRPAPGCPRGR